MVTHKERDYMYQTYAADPRARINLGIRRRLAPLMQNDADRIKLMNSLLLSMPGSPIIYYGDEIGMGDNVFLGDRNRITSYNVCYTKLLRLHCIGVRTPSRSPR